MSDKKRPILVFGATGQQGGSAAKALLRAGWPVRAFVRDPAAPGAVALAAAGADLVQGTFADTAAMRAAMSGAHGVFSVQPSSPGGTVSDADEERFGRVIADLGLETGIAHLVYSSVTRRGDEPTGLGHFDSKARIEAHIRALPVVATIVRPATFMDMLVMPGFGLDQGRFDFFLRPDQSMPFVAVPDIGKFVAAVFADRPRFGGTTLDLVGDVLTGRDLGILFSAAAGQAIAYARFADDVLAANPFLARLTALVDQGRLTSDADIDALRGINPELQTFRSWLAGAGRAPFRLALGTGGQWAYNRP